MKLCIEPSIASDYQIYIFNIINIILAKDFFMFTLRKKCEYGMDSKSFMFCYR